MYNIIDLNVASKLTMNGKLSGKIKSGKTAALLLVFFLSIVILGAQSASAYTSPYKVVVFTDKVAYLDEAYRIDTGAAWGTGGRTDFAFNLSLIHISEPTRLGM